MLGTRCGSAFDNIYIQYKKDLLINQFPEMPKPKIAISLFVWNVKSTPRVLRHLRARHLDFYNLQVYLIKALPFMQIASSLGAATGSRAARCLFCRSHFWPLLGRRRETGKVTHNSQTERFCLCCWSGRLSSCVKRISIRHASCAPLLSLRRS